MPLVGSPGSLYALTWGRKWSLLAVNLSSPQHCSSAGQEKAPVQSSGSQQMDPNAG